MWNKLSKVIRRPPGWFHRGRSTFLQWRLHNLGQVVTPCQKTRTTQMIGTFLTKLLVDAHNIFMNMYIFLDSTLVIWIVHYLKVGGFCHLQISFFNLQICATYCATHVGEITLSRKLGILTTFDLISELTFIWHNFLHPIFRHWKKFNV